MIIRSFLNLMTFLRAGKKDLLGYFTQLIDKNGDTFNINWFIVNTHIFLKPEFIKHVLVDKKDNYVRHAPIEFLVLENILKKYSLFTAEDNVWKQDRMILNTSFNEEAVKKHIDCVISVMTSLLNSWQKNANEKIPINISIEMNKFALRTLLETMFAGVDIDMNKCLAAMDDVSYVTALNKSAFFKIFFGRAYLLMNRQYRKSKKELLLLGDTLVNKCLASQNSENNVVKKLAEAYQAQHVTEHIHDKIRSETLTIFFAAQETTTSILVRTLVYLSQYPLIFQHIREEVTKLLGNNKITLDTLANLHYTRAVIQEVLRLHPPIFALPRIALEDDHIGQYKISKGDFILIPIYQIHRLPQYWPNPEGFDPSRFLKKHDTNYRFAYLPFGAGQHVCLGRHLAMLEMTIAIAMIALRYNLNLTSTSTLENENLFLHRLNRDVMMTVHESV